MFDTNPLSSTLIHRYVVNNDFVDLCFQTESGFFVELTRDGVKQRVPFQAPFSNINKLLPELIENLSKYSVEVHRNGQHVSFNRLLLGGGCCQSIPQDQLNEPLVPAAANPPVQYFQQQQQAAALPNEFPEELLYGIISTKTLAARLLATPLNTPERKQFQAIAIQILRAFDKKNAATVTPAILKEVTTLVSSDDPEIIKMLIELLFDKIDQKSFLDINLLEALRDVMRHVKDTNLLSPDRLMKMLRDLKAKYEDLHIQAQNVDICFRLLRVLSQVLDTMCDAKLKGVSYDKTIEPFYDQLKQDFFDHDDWRICTEARYALQALLRIGHDTSKLALYGKSLMAAASGIGSLKDAFMNKSPTELYNAYQSFKTAIDKSGKAAQKQEKWYDDFRFIKLMTLIEGHLGAYKKFLHEYLKDKDLIQKDAFFGIILLELSEIVCSNQSTDLRLEALNHIKLYFRAIVPPKDNAVKVVKIVQGSAAFTNKVKIAILVCLKDCLRDEGL